MSQIATAQLIEIEVITPLHIGAGGNDLLNEVDYICDDQIYVIDQNLAFADLPTDRLQLAAQGADLSRVIAPEQRATVQRYSLPRPNGPAVARIIPQIKDVFDHPYLPGSSLKGAIRTALARTLIMERHIPIDVPALKPSPRFADDPLLGDLLGRNPNNDLLRALQIRDSGPTDRAALDLAQVMIYSLTGRPGQLRAKGNDFRFAVETVRPGTRFLSEIALDVFLLSGQNARQLRFANDAIAQLRGWMAACAAHGQAIIDHELDFYRRHNLPILAMAYEQLAATATEATQQGGALLPIAWGGGWLGKTVGTVLDAPTTAAVRNQYRLGRREHPIFPKSRRLIEQNNQPTLPLGWVRLYAGQARPARTSAAVAVKPITIARPTRLSDVQAGMIVEGRIVRLEPYGAFVNIGVERNGLLHISQLADWRVNSVAEIVKIGQMVRVVVLNVDLVQGKLGLSLRGVEQP